MKLKKNNIFYPLLVSLIKNKSKIETIKISFPINQTTHIISITADLYSCSIVPKGCLKHTLWISPRKKPQQVRIFLVLLQNNNTKKHTRT